MVNWTRRERCHRGLVDDDFSRFEIGTADDYIQEGDSLSESQSAAQDACSAVNILLWKAPVRQELLVIALPDE